VSPTILTIALLILSGDHGKARMLVFLIANVVVLVAIGLIGLSLFRHSTAGGTTEGNKAATAAVDTAIGLILIAFGIRAAIRKTPEKDQAPKASSGPELARFALFGVAMMLTNFTTLALFIPADKEIALSHASVDAKTFTFILLVTLATITAWAPLLLATIAPSTADRVLGALDRWVTGHRKAITVTVCIGFGFYLILRGLTAG
jgi:hypothetical protein